MVRSLWPSAYQSYPISGSSSIVAGVCSGKSAQSMAMNAAQTNNPAEIAGPMVKIMSNMAAPLEFVGRSMECVVSAGCNVLLRANVRNSPTSRF